MKILLTTDTFYPMINGVVISTDYLYRQLKIMGHDVRIITLSSTGEEMHKGDIYYLKSFQIKIYPGLRAKSPFKNGLIREIIEWKPEIVHSQTEFSAMLISKKISRKVGSPHLHTYHTMYEDYLKYIFNGKLISRNTSKKLTKILLNSLDGVIVPTEKVRSVLTRYGVKKPLYTISTGIDISIFRNKISNEEKEKLLKDLGVIDKDILIYIGRIAEEKNIQEIIKYFSKISMKNREVNLLIVGGGPYLDDLIELTGNLNIVDRVIFTGMVDPKEIYKYYQLAQVFVTASTSETQGLTYIEALASGIPVVCRYDSCIENLIVNYENGFVFNSEEEFRKAIDVILSDKVIANKMIKNALDKANEYSFEIFAKKIVGVYSDILSRVPEADNLEKSDLKILRYIKREK